MRKKIKKWRSALLILVGISLLSGGFFLSRKEAAVRQEIERFNEAVDLVEAGDPEAAAVFFEVAVQTADPWLKARSFFNLATLGWMQGIEPKAIIGSYQEALRAQPGDREAAFNLELFYDLLREQQAGATTAGTGEGEDEGGGTSGDI